ncbi:MAG: hypothetical protein GY847_38805 [Proteobacteria bacterium]|nr:hypothetical protein [Pseudomonadota bacterium]
MKSNWTKRFVTVWIISVFLFPRIVMAQLFESAVDGSSAQENTNTKKQDENEDTDKQVPKKQNAASGTIGGFDFALGGYIRGDLYVGKVPEKTRAEVKTGYGEAALTLEVAKRPYGDAFSDIRLRSGYQGHSVQNDFNLREAYINLYLGLLDIRFGHQIIVWGRADIVNPTNNLTPIDMRTRSPEIDDQRLGNFGMRAFLNLSPFRIEGVWLPFYAPSHWPHIEIKEPLEIGEPEYPDGDLSNSLGAGRVHLELPKFEASVSYLHGHAPFPGLVMSDFDFSTTSPVIYISRRAYRHHVVGFDFSTAIGDWLGMRGEAAFRYPVNYKDDINVPRPDLQYVFGLDHEFKEVMIIAQYIGCYNLDWKKTEIVEDLPVFSVWDDQVPEAVRKQTLDQLNQAFASRNRIIYRQLVELQHSASLRIQWTTLHDTLSLEALGYFNFSTKELLTRVQLAYSITDSMKATVGGEMYMGPDNTLFDLIEETISAGYMELRVSF